MSVEARVLGQSVPDRCLPVPDPSKQGISPHPQPWALAQSGTQTVCARGGNGGHTPHRAHCCPPAPLLQPRHPVRVGTQYKLHSGI